MTHIVLTGNAGSGKDTAGIFLSTELGIQRIAFADEVRDMMWELNIPLYDTVLGQITYQVAVSTFGYDKAKRAFPDIRRTLDALATKIIRNRVDKDYFANITVNKALSMGGSIITDARFDNEKRIAKEVLDALVIKIDRPGTKKLDLESENITDNYVDVVVVNDGSVEDLYAKLEEVIGNEL